MRALLAAFAGLLLVLAISGCDKQPVATVNGIRITRGEFVERMEQATGREIMTNLIQRKLLESACNQAKIQVTPQEVQTEITKLRSNASDADWQQMLKQRGLTEESLKQTLTFELRVRKLQEKGITVTDQQLQAFFQQNRERFDRPATADVSQIVLAKEADAAKVRSELAKPNASFEALASQYSVDPQGREARGRVGKVPLGLGSDADPVRKAIASLQVGQVSQPIAYNGSWIILKVNSKTAAEPASYAKMKDDVRQAYMSVHAKQLEDIVKEQMATAKVNIVDPKYSELSKMFGQQQAMPTFGGETKGGASSAPAQQAPAAPAPTPIPAS